MALACATLRSASTPSCADGFRVQLARDVRVRGAHALAPRAHGVHLGEHRNHHRAARQELRRRPERVRAFQVLVESPRAGGRQPLLRPAHDVEPLVLRGAEHAVGQAGQHGVGLHDAHGLLHGVRCARVGAGTARARRLLSSAESARSSSSDASRQRLVRQLKSETQSAPFSPSGKRRGRRTVHEAPRCRNVDNGDIGGEARDIAAAAMEIERRTRPRVLPFSPNPIAAAPNPNPKPHQAPPPKNLAVPDAERWRPPCAPRRRARARPSPRPGCNIDPPAPVDVAAVLDQARSVRHRPPRGGRGCARRHLARLRCQRPPLSLEPAAAAPAAPLLKLRDVRVDAFRHDDAVAAYGAVIEAGGASAKAVRSRQRVRGPGAAARAAATARRRRAYAAAVRITPRARIA